MRFDVSKANEEFLKELESQDKKILEEQRKNDEEPCKRATDLINKQLEYGKLSILVGFEDVPFYLGVFCDKNTFTFEQIKILDNLNRKVISKLNYIFKKCENLSYTFTSLNKYLSELKDKDFISIEEIKREVIEKSTAGYLSESSLDNELKKVYKLVKCIQDYDKEERPQIRMYDYENVKSEYRKLHLIYRCAMCLDEWQNKRLSLYLGGVYPSAVEIITVEQFLSIKKKLHEFEIQQKKYHTSEILDFVIEADKKGTCDSVLLKKLSDKILLD